jgi:hypothetical protein
MGVVIRRFDVYLVNLDPTTGGEIQKTRPCVVVSPDEVLGFSEQRTQGIKHQVINK